jgi:hypothetical protein
VLTFFCPACWREIAAKCTRCPWCDAELAALDREPFDAKLLRALRHPDVETVMRAVDLLARRRTAGADDALAALYRERPGDPYLAAAIARALERIGGDTARRAIAAMRRDRSAIARRAADSAWRRLAGAPRAE